MAATPSEVAKRWFAEVWNGGNPETIDELMHPSSYGQTHAGVVTGPTEWRQQIWEPLMSAFSNLTIEVEDIVSEGDHVVIRWRVTMDHTGEGLGVPPSGQSVDFTGMTWMVVRNGQIVQGWDGWDSTGLLVQCVSRPAAHPDPVKRQMNRQGI